MRKGPYYQQRGHTILSCRPNEYEAEESEIPLGGAYNHHATPEEIEYNNDYVHRFEEESRRRIAERVARMNRDDQPGVHDNDGETNPKKGDI